MKKLRVAHYMNQFFAGIGGEDKADQTPLALEKPVGPGLLMEKLLGDRGEIAVTLVCGDNYFAGDVDRASHEMLDLMRGLDIDLLIAGPAFNAGRYGIACGAMCAAVQRELGIPAVTGMFEENPGVDLYRKSAYIFRTQGSAAGMAKALPGMVELGLKLCAGTLVTDPEVESCFSRGVKINTVSDRCAADRAIDLLLLKMAGQPFVSEIALPDRADDIPPAAAITDLSEATIAFVTEGGLVPIDNPDRIESSKATRWGSYAVEELEARGAAGFQSIHMGFDTGFINQDPNRLVPVDVLRGMERAGVFKKLFPRFFVTTGVATSIKNAESIGKGIAAALVAGGVSGVILTST
ncbi:MAG: glycine/betaine/sarcosine/D-proline family reductase selenoprotein B [Thermoleophilia bacterium]|nr:glycine/betaine/sarcosine/D-proline family reductase selenoprotein B [Thermoleophilia bacterium]